MIEHRIDSGIDTAMMIVLRQLPRKTRIMMAVKHAAMIASRTTPLIDARTKMDWSPMGVMRSASGKCRSDLRQQSANAFYDIQG